MSGDTWGGIHTQPTPVRASCIMDELERAAAVLAVYIDDFAEDDVEQREPGKALTLKNGPPYFGKMAYSKSTVVSPGITIAPCLKKWSPIFSICP